MIKTAVVGYGNIGKAAIEAIICSPSKKTPDIAEEILLKGVNTMGHSTQITRKGVSGLTHNQRFNFEMSINNPAMTAQMMISVARALVKCAPGAYTILHLPIIDMLPGTNEELIRRLM